MHASSCCYTNSCYLNLSYLYSVIIISHALAHPVRSRRVGTWGQSGDGGDRGRGEGGKETWYIVPKFV